MTDNQSTARDGVELLPCPFCGGSNVKTYGPYGWYRQWCISHSCKAFYNGASDAMKDFPSEAEAVAAWNTRALTTTPAQPDGYARGIKALPYQAVFNAISDAVEIKSTTCVSISVEKFKESLLAAAPKEPTR